MALVIAILLAATARKVYGQNPVASQPAAAQQAQPAPLQIGSLTVDGSIRTRAEGWGWFNVPHLDNLYAFPGTLIRLGIGQTRKDFDWRFEIAVPVLLGLPDKAVAPAPQGQFGFGGSYYASNHNSQYTAMAFPKQAYLRFKHLGSDEGESLQFGRFEYFDGLEVTPSDATLAALVRERVAQRLIGNFTYSDIERSFDGFRYVLSRPSLNLTAVGAIPTRGVYQVDGWGWLHTGLVYVALSGQIIGKQNSAGEWRVFGIYYDDWRHVLKTDNRSTALRQLDMGNIKLGTYGGHYLQTLQTVPGTADFLLWGAFQTGSWGSLDNRAGAFAGELGFQPKLLKAVRPWLRAGYFYGSGDGNPADGRHGTFFQIFPTARQYARFPFFNLMNNEDAFGELILRPKPTVTIRSDIHTLRLANSNDLWYTGGGAFQPWTFGYTGRPSNGARSLATLYDISLDYRLNAHLATSWYLGYAKGKTVIRKIYPTGHDGQLGFLEITYRF